MTVPPKVAAAAATILWGFTYIVTTKMLPHNPMFIAAARAFGGGVPLLLLARDVPPVRWWIKLVILGTLNSGLFFALLFVAAIRMPGGVTATFQALGPLFIVLLAWPLLGAIPSRAKVLAAVAGAAGVSMVVLKGEEALDPIGLLAAFGAAFSVALGGALTHKWGRPSSVISLTAWQMIVAGIELTAVALYLNDVPGSLNGLNVVGLSVLALLVTALPFALWFGAIRDAGAASVAPMLLLTPLTAFALDAIFRAVVPTTLQGIGMAVVIGSLLYGQHTDRRAFRVAHHHTQMSKPKRPEI